MNAQYKIKIIYETIKKESNKVGIGVMAPGEVSRYFEKIKDSKESCSCEKGTVFNEYRKICMRLKLIII